MTDTPKLMIPEKLAEIRWFVNKFGSMHNASAALIRERDGLKTKLGHLETELRERSEEWAKRIDALDADNKQLRAERDRFAKDREDVVVALGKHAHPGLSPAGSVVDLARENEQLREELAPFLEMARDAAEIPAAPMCDRGDLTSGVVRRIAARHKEQST